MRTRTNPRHRPHRRRRRARDAARRHPADGQTPDPVVELQYDLMNAGSVKP